MKKHFSKLLSLAVAVVLLLGTFTSIPFSAKAEAVQTVYADKKYTAKISENGGEAVFEFTPQKTEMYMFAAESETDTVGSIYSESGELIEKNDDYSGSDFGVICVLEKDRRYVLKASFYQNDEVGSFSVAVSVAHGYQEYAYKAPTCSEPGYSDLRCEYCGETKRETVPTRHNYVVDDSVAPTCTKSGRIKVYCDLCGQVLQDSPVDALGHYFVFDSYKNGVVTERCNTCNTAEKTKKAYILNEDTELGLKFEDEDYKYIAFTPKYTASYDLLDIADESSQGYSYTLYTDNGNEVNNLSFFDSFFPYKDTYVNVDISADMTAGKTYVYSLKYYGTEDNPVSDTFVVRHEHEYGDDGRCRFCGYEMYSQMQGYTGEDEDSHELIYSYEGEAEQSLYVTGADNDGAFDPENWFAYRNNIKKLVLGSKVQSIGSDMDKLSHLCEIDVAEDNPYFDSVDGVLYTKNHDTLVCYPRAKKGNSYKVLDGTAALSKSAFAGSSLSTVSLPQSLQELGDYTFSDCPNLTELVVPNSGVRTVNGGYFSDTYSAIVDVTLPRNVTVIYNLGVNSVTDYSGEVVDKTPIEGFTIYGFGASAAEQYAKENRVNFVTIYDGDIDGNSELEVIDCTMLQRSLAELLPMTDRQKVVADYNLDGDINIIDATDIQNTLAER